MARGSDSRGRGGRGASGRGGGTPPPPPPPHAAAAAGGGRGGWSGAGAPSRGGGRGGGGRDSGRGGRGAPRGGGGRAGRSPGRGGWPEGGRGGSGGSFRGSHHHHRRAPELGLAAAAAAVAQGDRELLLVGRDAKSPRVWELRLHPGQHFSTAWLAAVGRWAHNMAAQQAQLQARSGQPPPPPPRQPPFPPAGVSDMHDDDYDDDSSSSSMQGEDDDGALEHSADEDGDADSGVSEGSGCDMLTFLQKMSLQDPAAADAFSTATTHGSVSSAGGSIMQQRGAPARAAAAAASRRAAAVADAAALAASDSGSWETDDGEGERGGADAAAEQAAGGSSSDRSEVDAADVDVDAARLAAEEADLLGGSSQQDSSAAAESGFTAAAILPAADDDDDDGDGGGSSHASVQDWSDADADAALTAAEEQDLLGEAEDRSGMEAPLLQQQQHAGSAAIASGSAAAAGSSNGGGGQRAELLVSLRLERQALTDKEAQLLADWYTAGGDLQQVLTISKLWLFNNALGDDAAPALARLIAASPHLCEVHLSHNQLGAQGATALLAAVPLPRPGGMKPLWLRVEYNQIAAEGLMAAIQQEHAARGLVVDVAQHVPSDSLPNTTGRELSLRWNLPWQSVHVQMPWLSCQRAPPAEAAVLQAAKAVWGRRAAGPAAAAAPAGAAGKDGAGRSSSGGGGGGSSWSGTSGVVGALANTSPDVPLPLQYAPAAAAAPPPPPPPPRAQQPPPPPGRAAGSASPPTPPPPPQQQPPPPPPRTPAFSNGGSAANGAAAAAPANGTQAGSAAAAAAAPVAYADGPLMLFMDTSALLPMIGGNAATPTAFTLSLLQALAASGRFGRGLPAEQQTFLVLADTVLKQLDSLKAAEPAVGGPIRKFLDKGLDEAGGKGADFLTCLAAHEGEGLVIDRHAAVAGSHSHSGPTGQKNDLAIIEVALFFRRELLQAATAAGSDGGGGGGGGGGAADAQPVILVTNDNAQLQLAKSHGLPAFKLTGASDFEAALSDVIRGGGDLTSAALRGMLAPSATAGCGSVMAQRSLQDDFDGAVAVLKGLSEAYEDLSGLLGRVSLLAAGAAPGEEAAALAELQALLQEHQHVQPFASTGASSARPGGGAGVMEAAMANLSALQQSLGGWEERIKRHQTPSRVLQWAGSSSGRRAAGAAAGALTQ